MISLSICCCHIFSFNSPLCLLVHMYHLISDLHFVSLGIFTQIDLADRQGTNDMLVIRLIEGCPKVCLNGF